MVCEKTTFQRKNLTQLSLHGLLLGLHNIVPSRSALEAEQKNPNIAFFKVFCQSVISENLMSLLVKKEQVKHHVSFKKTLNAVYLAKRSFKGCGCVIA